MPLPDIYARHRVVPQKRFGDLKVGDRYALPPRTLGDGNFVAFQAVSLDNHPIHYDVEYCKALGHPGPLAHGLQLLSLTAAGAGLFPHEIGEALVGMLGISAQFKKAAYPGDTLYPVLEITRLEPQRTTGIVTMSARISNQRGETVLEGEHT